MGITYARGTIIGKSQTRQYLFLVDTGSTWMTLPPQDIVELQLDRIEGQDAIIETPTDIIRRPFYSVTGTMENVPFADRVVPANRPMVGYELLQQLGFVVDLVSERIVLKSQWNVDSR